MVELNFSNVAGVAVAIQQAASEDARIKAYLDVETKVFEGIVLDDGVHDALRDDIYAVAFELWR